MLGIFALRGNAAEIVRRPVIVALLEANIPHPYVVLLAVLGRQRAVIHLIEGSLRIVVSPCRTRKRRKGELHVVGMHRPGVLPQEIGQPRSGAGLLHLHRAHRRIVVGFGAQRRFERRNRPASRCELLFGIRPAAQFEKLAAPFETVSATGCRHRRTGFPQEAAERRNQQYHSFTHRSIRYERQLLPCPQPKKDLPDKTIGQI